MLKKIFLSLTILTLPVGQIYGFTISIQTARTIADKIWHNECAGTVTGLTTWKAGENFASLGIGHFIWHPAGAQECFKESFPELLKFLQHQGVKLPVWLKTAKHCPWNSRAEFNANFDSPEMQELRQLLLKTKNLQAIFIAKRLERTFPDIIKNLPSTEQAPIRKIFFQLAKDPRGLYALIDYLNFKGSGTVTSEAYNHHGWGLLQVLQHIPADTNQPVQEFIDAAKAILTERVKNSPPTRNEAQWLTGWFNRLDTYKK